MLTILLLIAGVLATPCATEDANVCTWYSNVQGNGSGDNFIAITDELLIRF